MADVMKIGGKTPSNTVKGVAVNADGKLDTVKTWDMPIVELFSDTVSDTEGHLATNLDLSPYPLVSLRIKNQTGVPVDITPLVDLWDNTNGLSLKYINGSTLTFQVPSDSNYFIVMPNDYPWLNYVKYLKLRIQATDTPAAETPTLSVWAVVRK